MKLIILITGPESSGTRFFREVFASNNQILNDKKIKNHADILDEFWKNLEEKKITEAIKKFPKNPKNKIIVTRRSIPSGIKPGQNAKYMVFPNLELFIKLSKNMGYEILLLVTSRSPIANIISMKENRSSVNGSITKAFNQYQGSYRYLFKIIDKYNLIFFLVSIESLVHDKEHLINSLYKYLEITYNKSTFKVKKNINMKYYKDFLNK